jgi:hypothetical protein
MLGAALPRDFNTGSGTVEEDGAGVVLGGYNLLWVSNGALPDFDLRTGRNRFEDNPAVGGEIRHSVVGHFANHVEALSGGIGGDFDRRSTGVRVGNRDLVRIRAGFG